MRSPTWPPQLRPINWGTAVAVPHGWRWCLRRSEGCHQWHRDQPSPCQQHVLRHPSGEWPFFERKMNHLYPFMDDLLTAYYIYLLKMVIFHIAIGENAIENHGKTCSSQYTPDIFCSFDGEITPIKIQKKYQPMSFPHTFPHRPILAPRMRRRWKGSARPREWRSTCGGPRWKPDRSMRQPTHWGYQQLGIYCTIYTHPLYNK